MNKLTRIKKKMMMLISTDDTNQPPDIVTDNKTNDASNNENDLSVYFKILMYVMYISISLLAILGNGIVVYLVVAFQRMKTVTNIFIVNLAIGDILMAILCIPFTFISNLLLQYWPFGSTLCSLVCYSQAVSVFVSAYTLVAISIDRYMAIIFPLKMTRMSKAQAQLIILLIWLVALLTPLPTALLSSLVPIPQTNQTITGSNSTDLNQSFDNLNNVNRIDNSVNNLDDDLVDDNVEIKYTCREEWPDKTQRYYYSMTLMILQYFLPLSVLVYTYTKIAYVVFGRPIAANADQVRAHQSKQKMIKMMIIVCVIYSLCWAPLNTLIVVADLNENIWQFNYIIYIWLISHLLAMSHCSVNPFIYIWMNNKFRSGFKHIFFSIMAFCGFSDKLSENGNFQPSVHNYSIQTQYTQRRPFNKQNRLKQSSNDNSNNSNEPVDIELALVSDNNNNDSRHLNPAALKNDLKNNLKNNLKNDTKTDLISAD